MKRAVCIFGAGASLCFGAPSTSELNQRIENFLEADEYARQFGLGQLYEKIRLELEDYFRNPDHVNFEQIYHIAHELMQFEEPQPRTVAEYRPVLQPFLNDRYDFPVQKLRPLCDQIIRAVYISICSASQEPNVDLCALSAFIERMQRRYRMRVYTTNYDNFLWQVLQNYYTGFSQPVEEGMRRFDRDGFFDQEDTNCLYHLHGSIHLGYSSLQGEFGELFWFDDLDHADQHMSFNGSDKRRMDGSQIVRTPILTGLDKLGRLQEKPMSFYQTALARDLLQADTIIIVGCGLGDLHINYWINQARMKSKPPSLLMVDHWNRPYWELQRLGERGRKEMEILHSLRVDVKNYWPKDDPRVDWSLDDEGQGLIYSKGFDGFLAAPEEFQEFGARIGIF